MMQNDIAAQILFLGFALEPLTPAHHVATVKLQHDQHGESALVAYAPAYLTCEEPISLNPAWLPLRSESYTFSSTPGRPGAALPLTLRDALPDRWGRHILQSLSAHPLDDIDILLSTNTDRVGALVFSEHPEFAPPEDLLKLQDLGEVDRAIHHLQEDLPLSQEMRCLLLRSSTLGGARPKATFGFQGRRWLAKFPAIGDDLDVQVLEAATLLTAERSGINVPRFKLEPGHYGQILLVERFDRQGTLTPARRLHFFSAAAALNCDYATGQAAYTDLATFIRQFSMFPDRDLREMYRRMVFNILIDNTDDHVRNHGFLCAPGRGLWLSPAFDMVPQLTNLPYQQLGLKPGSTTPSIDLIYEVASAFDLSSSVSHQVVEYVRAGVATFEAALKTCGASSQLTDQVLSSLTLKTQAIGLNCV